MHRLLFPLVGILLGSSALAQERAVVVTACGTPPGTYAAGESRPILQDTNGKLCGTDAAAPTATAANGITPVVSTAAESGHVLKSGAGNLYGLSVTTGAAAGYVMIFNATSAPVDGAVTPTHCYSIGATSSLGASWNIPAAFSTGITVVFSTTGCFTKTASATAFFSGSVK